MEYKYARPVGSQRGKAYMSNLKSIKTRSSVRELAQLISLIHLNLLMIYII